MEKIWMTIILLVLCSNTNYAKDESDATIHTHPTLLLTDYGNNLIRFQPVVVATGLGIGWGISYERYFSQEQKFEVVVPFALMFKNASPKDNYKNRQGAIRGNRQKYIYFHPGVKIIASNPKSKVTYGIGPNLLFGWTGTKLDYLTQFSENGQVDHYYQDVQKIAVRLGLMVNNYLDIRLNNHFFWG